MNLDELMKVVSGARASLEAKSGKNNILKPPMGKSRWRILPGWRPAEEAKFYHEFAQHWIKDETGAVKAVMVCDRITFGRDCDICGLINEVMRGFRNAGITKDSGNKTFKTIDDMRAKSVFLVNALRVDGDSQNAKQPYLLGLPGSVFEEFISKWATRYEDGINLLDPNEGRDIIIERSGSGFDTRYSVTDAAKSTRIDPEALKNRLNIDAFIEAERQKGLQKGLALVQSTVRGVISGGGVSGAARLSPPAAAQVAAGGSRVIEADEISAAEASFVKPAELVPPAEVARPAAKPAPVAEISDDPLGDDELSKLLADLA